MSTPSIEKAQLQDNHQLNEKDGHEKLKVIQVKNADLALALSTGPQLSPTSPQSLQLFAILLVAFMGSLSNGFDGSGRSISYNGVPSFKLCDQLWVLLMECRMSISSQSDASYNQPYRQYLDYFGITGQDAGGGVGTSTAIIFGIVSYFYVPITWAMPNDI